MPAVHSRHIYWCKWVLWHNFRFGPEPLVPLVAAPSFFAFFCRMRTCNSDNGVWFSFLCSLPIELYCKLYFYVCHVIIYFIMYHIKSGIGSCIAPKAGIARHPAKGRYERLGMLSRTLGFWCSQAVHCPGPGYILGQPRVCHRQAQRARVQAPYSIRFPSEPEVLKKKKKKLDYAKTFPGIGSALPSWTLQQIRLDNYCWVVIFFTQ